MCEYGLLKQMLRTEHHRMVTGLFVESNYEMEKCHILFCAHMFSLVKYLANEMQIYLKCLGILGYSMIYFFKHSDFV